MLLRSLLRGLRACSGSGMGAGASRTAPLLLPSAASAAASAAAASSSSAGAAPRFLSSLCSSLAGGFSSRSSAAAGRWTAQLGSAASSSSSLGSTAAAAAAAGGTSLGPSWVCRQLVQLRPRTTASHLKLRFTGGKIKPYSSYKSRFRVTGSGKVLYARPGHVHKRFSKTKRQLFDLSQYQTLTPRYAKTVKKIGFKMRKF